MMYKNEFFSLNTPPAGEDELFVVNLSNKTLNHKMILVSSIKSNS
jgi:hypothetical protein